MPHNGSAVPVHKMSTAAAAQCACAQPSVQPPQMPTPLPAPFNLYKNSILCKKCVFLLPSFFRLSKQTVPVLDSDDDSRRDFRRSTPPDGNAEEVNFSGKRTAF